MQPPPPSSTLFPYTTLFRSSLQSDGGTCQFGLEFRRRRLILGFPDRHPYRANLHFLEGFGTAGDRKSTRLNSSHSSISYAVFCLKKKNFQQQLVRHFNRLDN